MSSGFLAGHRDFWPGQKRLSLKASFPEFLHGAQKQQREELIPGVRDLAPAAANPPWYVAFCLSQPQFPHL